MGPDSYSPFVRVLHCQAPNSEDLLSSLVGLGNFICLSITQDTAAPKSPLLPSHCCSQVTSHTTILRSQPEEISTYKYTEKVYKQIINDNPSAY